MPTLILAALALLGCGFLIYVFFQWLREELNPRRPASTHVRRKPATEQRPFVVRKPHRGQA